MNIDNEYILDFAKEILEIPSPSGYCKEVIERIKKEANKYNLSFKETKKGNLIIDIFDKKDSSKKDLGLAVHVDTLGLMVRSISPNGNINFTKIGGPILPTLDGEYCTIHTRNNKKYTGTVLSLSPASHVFKDAGTKERNEDTMYIRLDEVFKKKDDVKKLGIEVGDYVSIDPKVVITDSGYIKSRFLDDKINVASIFGLIKTIKEEDIKLNYNVSIIVSTYEEVGHGSSYIPEFDEFIAVDMGCVGKDLTCTEQMVSICAKDSSGPYDYDINSKLIEVSKNNEIGYAVDVYPFYGSDVTAARFAGNDFKGALIGPGVHASHGMERTHIDGINNTIKLLIEYCSK